MKYRVVKIKGTITKNVVFVVEKRICFIWWEIFIYHRGNQLRRSYNTKELAEEFIKRESKNNEKEIRSIIN